MGGLVGGTGEPRELVRCVGQRARSTPFSFLIDPFLRAIHIAGAACLILDY
uniref:Uncharacterized protein n=1 Tax=Utricularia reniformis TaxID=192314 RepID=A0A1Y0B187_9LAMI|nr:hypothetical protein AEK19_MT0888 [Utricularia reniformis]ART31119.1 hypothetical protein AEK19_MT0888 [Utricularia reniformis]